MAGLVRRSGACGALVLGAALAPGPVSYERGEQFWLFTVYDAVTLSPLTSVPVFATRPAVTIDNDDCIFLVGRGVQVFHPDDPPMRAPTELNVARLVDISRHLSKS